MATAINLHKYDVDNIIEFTSDEQYAPGIHKPSSEEKGYYLRTYINKWVFPWKYTFIPININNISLPDDTIGFIQTSGFYEDIIDVKTKILIYDEECCYLRVKANGIFPRKIYANENIATLHVLSYRECHLVNSN